MTDLTKKDKPWKWGFTEERLFQKLKEECLKESVLKMFDPKKSDRMETDASDLAIDACFSQEYKDMWHPVAYYSRKLSPAEQNYDIYNKKLLAIVAVLDAWRVYTKETPELTILTDHKNLLHFITTKKLNRRQIR